MINPENEKIEQQAINYRWNNNSRNNDSRICWILYDLTTVSGFNLSRGGLHDGIIVTRNKLRARFTRRWKLGQGKKFAGRFGVGSSGMIEQLRANRSSPKDTISPPLLAIYTRSLHAQSNSIDTLPQITLRVTRHYHTVKQKLSDRRYATKNLRNQWFFFSLELELLWQVIDEFKWNVGKLAGAYFHNSLQSLIRVSDYRVWTTRRCMFYFFWSCMFVFICSFVRNFINFIYILKSCFGLACANCY